MGENRLNFRAVGLIGIDYFDQVIAARHSIAIRTGLDEVAVAGMKEIAGSVGWNGDTAIDRSSIDQSAISE